MNARVQVLAVFLCVLVMSYVFVTDGPVRSTAAAANGRLTVFISDLHFGVGKDPENPEQWHAMEDFRWAAEFTQFLKAVDQLGTGRTDLVLNGDTFELWQSLTDDCHYDNTNLGCTEDEALTRIQRVISSHTTELHALGEFARAANNRVVLIPGNHDAALLFPRVAEVVLEAISAPGRVHLISEGIWRSPDKLIYVEHGHQIGKEVNKWEKWPAPFIEKDGRRYVQRPWGEQFVQAYYNMFEHKYPIIDNISVEGEGVKYAMATEGVTGTIRDVAGFVNFFLFKVSWDQFTSSLGDQTGKPPEWDVKQIRQESAHFLLDSLPADHPFYQTTERALAKGELAILFQNLTDEDIKTICDERAALFKLQREVLSGKQKTTIGECPRKDGTLGAGLEALLRARDKVLAEHLEKTCEVLSECFDHPFQVFVFSHTHLAVPPYSPIKKGDWRPLVVNTGAWQRVVTPDQLTTIKSQRGLPKENVLPKLIPEDLPLCYSVVLIKPYESTQGPVPVLRYWGKGQGDAWTFKEQCG